VSGGAPWRRSDALLFLTPEVEREVPRLCAELGLADERREARRVEELVLHGSEESWFAYLRERRRSLEQAAAVDAAPAAAERLALVLLEQYLLAPSLRPPDARDDDERRRLAALAD
jgi:hypothetical protein